MSYYSKNALEYIERTKDANMQEIYDFFLNHITNKGSLLDVGFGSARDMLYFKNIGFDVYGIDNEPKFVEEAKKLELSVECIDILTYKDDQLFDYIWAQASLLHINKLELNKTFINLSNHLTKNGLICCSFKYGDFEGIIDERYYIYLTEESIHAYLNNTNLEIIDYKITLDKLNRGNNWINFVLKKH